MSSFHNRGRKPFSTFQPSSEICWTDNAGEAEQQMHGAVYDGKCESDKREQIAQPYRTENIALGESDKRRQIAQPHNT